MKLDFKNNELTNQIILHTTILSNNISDEYEKDAKKIIDFICEAYNSNENDAYFKLVTYDISNLSTFDEYEMMLNRRNYDTNHNELDFYYDLKGRAINRLKNLALASYSQKGLLDIFASFNYDKVLIYEANERRDEIINGAMYGNVELALNSGILYALGIGGAKDLNIAKLRFLQAAYWGCFPAFKYVKLICEKQNDLKMAKVYEGLYMACNKFLACGITKIPEEHKKEYSNEVSDLFVLISSIYLDIIIEKHLYNINYSFVEVMLLENISILAKLSFIDKYDRGEWKEITNGISKDGLRFGFKL